MRPVLVRGGTVVGEGRRRAADVLCEGGKIAAVGEGLAAPEGTEVLDAAGMLVLPGFIDPHVHAHLPLAAASAKSDYANTSKSALLGGTTCFMDFAGAGPERDFAEALEKWHRAADGRSFCDYRWHLTVTRFDAQVERDLDRLVEAGLRSVKIYLAYRPYLAVDDETLFAILSYAARKDLVVMAHCENADLVPALQRRLLAEGKTGPEWHGASRPPAVEAEGVCRFLTFAEMTGARAYVVHVSSREALEMADRFRGRLRELRLETMMHYLLLDESLLARPGFEGAKWVLSPPLRRGEDREALWAALAEGRIDTLATDHCPFDFAGQKELGRGDFSKIPNGIGGVGERLPLAMAHGVAAGRLELERLVAVGAENPAKIFGLWPRKGRIAPGSDADVTVWNPAWTGRVEADSFANAADYDPYEGMALAGRAEWVLAAGGVQVRRGAWAGGEPRGTLV